MSIIDTLITNRTQADVDALRALYAKPKAMWTADEWNEFLLGNHRGAYNASDMNRVLDALDYLAERVHEFGYVKPEIKRPSILETVTTEVESRLPEGYTELEYIQSSGTQKLDTRVQVKSTVGFIVEFALTSASGTHGIIGGFTYGGYNHNFAALSGQWITQYGNNAGYQFGTTDTKRHTISQNVDSGCVIFDGTVVKDGLTYSDNTARTFSLCCYNGGDSYPAFWPGSLKIYACQIYDNGTLVRDYVPCLHPDNEIGLYDLVTKAFYGNEGTGVFVAGPKAEWSGTITEIIVRNCYKIGDCSPVSEQGRYLENVAKMRSILELPNRVPAVPSDMAAFTIEEANHIEIILTAVEALLNRIPLSWVYSGEFTAGEV